MDLVLEADALYIGGFYNCPELWPSVPDLLATCKLKGMTTLLSPQYDATEVGLSRPQVCMSANRLVTWRCVT
jgi:hypothetical protein